MDDMAEMDLTPGVLDLSLYRGDTTTVQLTLTDDATPPQPLEITGDGWSAQVRKSRSSDEAVGVITVDAIDYANSVLALTFPALDAGSYVWDVQQDDGGVVTYVTGRITVMRDVTRS